MSEQHRLVITDVITPVIRITNWTVERGECWAVLGRNGSGKQHLTRLLTGKLELQSGHITHQFKRIGVLSFEQQQRFFEQEIKNDDTDVMDEVDIGSTVAEMLGIAGALPPALQFLGLEPLLQRGYRQLSSGEARKTLLAQQWLEQPDLLILDEPFDSLDRNARENLSRFFEQARQSGTTLLFLLNTIEDVFPWHSHIALLEKGELVASGAQHEMRENPDLVSLLAFDSSKLPAWPEALPRAHCPDPLIALRDGKVQYGDTLIFSGVDLVVNHGSHTLITGRNGSGKSTLLGLLTGDHPQCYGNDLHLFGKPRGSGETIWELKKRMGIVTPALHRDHRVSGSTLHIVLAGFFDSIGLYDRTDIMQVHHAERWLALVGLSDRRDVPFKQLSYGEQRLALIARALVKQPFLLILDEPTQGLDDINRHRVLYFLEHLANQRYTTILMASHRQDEFLPLFTQHLEL